MSTTKSKKHRMQDLSHQNQARQVDLKSLHIHQWIAKKLCKDPGLFLNAKKTLEKQLQNKESRSYSYALMWRDEFKKGITKALEVATEDSERSQTLRQCSPFSNVLTNKERFDCLKAWTAKRIKKSKRASP